MHRPAANSDIFRAIADPTRRAILERLKAGPAPVKALAADFSQSRPSISKHLRILHEAGAVSEQRAGRERIYRIEPQTLMQVDSWISSYRSLWQDNLTRLKTYLEQS